MTGPTAAREGGPQPLGLLGFFWPRRACDKAGVAIRLGPYVKLIHIFQVYLQAEATRPGSCEIRPYSKVTPNRSIIITLIIIATTNHNGNYT